MIILAMLCILVVPYLLLTVLGALGARNREPAADWPPRPPDAAGRALEGARGI